ncbi:MAG: glycosyltransferase [Proteobacteria bacterium]|nr:glycosyltransferase family 4 protein [Desulfobulbaceae bacterium]MBU4153498.1 glycosyltransferase [Pseudomonadota bacterium]
MNILMMTNTFTPHVGGVARSIESFTAAYRSKGHQVMVVAPTFENMPADENNVIRIPAIQRFNGSDFSVILPTPGFLSDAIINFQPDIVHVHHPFLIGDTALRIAKQHELPLVFTHHTMYEQYTHYVPGNSTAMKKFIIKLSTSYANLCNLVFAPSASIATILLDRGVVTPIEVVPTGVNLELYEHGNGMGFRSALDIPLTSFVIGHLGRLAPEKNLEFLTMAIAAYLTTDLNARFLVIGSGPSEKIIRSIFKDRNLANRLHIVSRLDHPLLASAYKAMDIFAFASKSETQGMVLTEAMAAGVPVVALNAPGVREVVQDNFNGLLLPTETIHDFSAALRSLALLQKDEFLRFKIAAELTARKFSLENSATKALELYESIRNEEFINRQKEYSAWQAITGMISAEWSLVKNLIEAADAAIHDEKT